MERRVNDREHDVVIVGGGPAGVSAALECADIQLDVVLLEAGATLGGQLVEILHPIRNVATGGYESGAALQAGLQAVAKPLGDRIRCGHPVTAAGLTDGWVEANGVRFRAKALLIASGTVPERLPAAVDGAFAGDVTYQIESDPDRFAGRTMVVVGGGDSATLDALALAANGSHVFLAHRSPLLTARQDIVAQVRAQPLIEDLPGWEVSRTLGDEHLTEVQLTNRATGTERSVPAGGLVVKISREPVTDAVRGQLELDRRGFVVTDPELRTSLPGVFAAGDVVSGAYWRVANALGQGSLVSRTILHHLQDRAGHEPASS
jgi:thioredoxin reductase (NADPH)